MAGKPDNTGAYRQLADTGYQDIQKMITGFWLMGRLKGIN
jgi:hypothetical protein